MREPDIERSEYWVDEPQDAFDEIEQIEFFARDLRIRYKVERHNDGDMLIASLEYVNPEGRQVDVDAFLPTHHEDEYVIDFGIELPED